MGIDLNVFAQRLAAQTNRRSKRIFILKEGESATVLFNPHPDYNEPVDAMTHYFKPPGFFINCAAGDPRFPDGCPACTINRPFPHWMWNLYDKRRFHVKKSATRLEYVKCSKSKRNNCVECEDGSEAKVNGNVVWETSADIAKLIRDYIVEQVMTRCKCGGNLHVTGWQCPSCKEVDEEELPALTQRIVCPFCSENVQPLVSYKCSDRECERSEPADITDVWTKVKRSGSKVYSFTVSRMVTEEEREEMKDVLKPVDLDTFASAPPIEEFNKSIGKVSKTAQLEAPSSSRHKQLTAGNRRPAQDVEFDD